MVPLTTAVHTVCFNTWKKKREGYELRCVWCNTAWPRGKTGQEFTRHGYLNMAGAMGINRVRDTSWVLYLH